ncbi:structural maintenance of chromosomes protein 3 homolog [Mytilus californianus]|uniref:structural maintenance of chromosomes protein 3 homolog n=1 Tax=Mytilus californianus TaxID=6549 RepID=UPI002247209E|nr:structural maintenance of chromosomes protein 3 homolog [Mytilus californianus]
MCASDSKLQNLKSTEDATYKRIAEDLANELQISQEKKSSEVNQLKRKLEKTVDLQERKIKKVKLKNKTSSENLKSKVQQQNSKIKKLRCSCKNYKTQNRRLSSCVVKHKSCAKELRKNLTDIENINKSKTDEIKKLKSELNKIQSLYKDALKQSNEHAELVSNLKTNLNDSMQTRDYLHSLIQDDKEIDILDDKLRAYTPEFRQAVMNISDKKIFNASVKGKALSIEALTENVKKLIEEAASKDVSENIQQRSSRMPIRVGKKVRHTFNEGTFTAKVISTVPGFPDYYNLIYDNELDSEGKCNSLPTVENLLDIKSRAYEILT